MAFDAHSNFGYSTVIVAPAPALSGTSLTLAAGGGALMPAAPFNCTVWPSGTGSLESNAEIVRVTAVVGDVLTITRAQEGTSAKPIAVGYQFANSITVKVITDIEAATGGGSGTGLLISSMPYFGTATLNDVFGGFTAPAVCQIERIQIAAQSAPSGADIEVTLVDGGGVSLGAIGVLSDGSTYEETVLGAPLVLAPGDIVRAKLTAVDGTGGYLTVNLL